MTASNLDENNECNEEYEDSLTRPLNDDSGNRFARTWKDQASFIPPNQFERNGAGSYLMALKQETKT